MSEASIFLLRDQRLTWMIYCVFIALVAGIYFGSLSELMLEVDDARTFHDNIAVAQDFTYLFSSDKEVGSGRLTSDFVRFIAYLLVGNQPGSVHLFLVAVHTLASLLLARLAFRLGLPLHVSLLSGLLFLINVAQFRAVHWIAALDYPLALLWGCLTLLAYLRYRDQPHPLRLALFYLCLLLSLLTHLVSALVLPFFVYLLWRQKQPLRDCLRHFAWPAILSPLVLYGVLSSTAKTTTTWWAIERYAADGGVELLLGCARMLLWLLSRMATTAYWLPLPLYEQQEWELYGGAVFLVLLLGLIWKQVYPFDTWALWILMALVPFALLTEGTASALLAGPSRYLYLATGGTAVMLGWSLVWLGQWIGLRLRTRSSYVLAGLLAPLLISSYVSLKKAEALSFYISSRYYTSSGNKDEGIAQMRRALDRGPEMLRLEDTYVRLISQLFARGQDAQAVVEDALAIFPDDAVLLAQSYVLESVSPDSAIRARGRQQLDRAIKYIPPEELKNYIELVAMSYHNMGVGLYKKNDIEGAIQAYQRTLEVAPERLNTLKQLATLLFVLRYLEETQALVSASPHAAADAPSPLYLRALKASFEGRIDEAIVFCRQALDLDPSEEIFYLLNHCYEKKGQLDKALEALHQAVLIAGDQVSYRTYFQLGTLYHRTGQFDQAVIAYRHSIRLHSQEAVKLYKKNDIEGAIQAYQKALEVAPDQSKMP
jgi:tetratricopeptide (TPR) repeat protein